MLSKFTLYGKIRGVHRKNVLGGWGGFVQSYSNCFVLILNSILILERVKRFFIKKFHVKVRGDNGFFNGIVYQ